MPEEQEKENASNLIKPVTDRLKTSPNPVIRNPQPVRTAPPVRNIQTEVHPKEMEIVMPTFLQKRNFQV